SSRVGVESGTALFEVTRRRAGASREKTRRARQWTEGDGLGPLECGENRRFCFFLFLLLGWGERKKHETEKQQKETKAAILAALQSCAENSPRTEHYVHLARPVDAGDEAQFDVARFARAGDERQAGGGERLVGGGDRREEVEQVEQVRQD